MAPLLTGMWGRLTRWLLLPVVVAVLMSLMLSVLMLALGRERFGVIVAWLMVASIPWAYVRQVRQARQRLLSAVLGQEPPGEGDAVRSSFSRVQGLMLLRDAVRAARGGDDLLAEVSLQKVDRTELGAWELRVYESIRVLICLRRGETERAAQLAPLALPTGNADLDRRLGCMMLRAAWSNEARLGAIERGLAAVGASLYDLVMLCRVRQGELARGEGLRLLSPRVCARLSAVATEVGDERLASDLLARSVSQAAYR